MAPPPGRLGGAVKMPVQVRMFPEEIATVDAFAAALSQQSYGAAFSRAEALRIAAMEWLKERQARVPPAPPPRAPAATPEIEAAAAPADPEHGPGVPPPPPPAEPSSRQGQILAALTAAGTHGLRPPPGDGRQCAAGPGAAGAGPHSARPLCGDGAGARGGALRRRAGLGQVPGRLCAALIPSSHLWTNAPQR